jgi:hypothetical protein
MGFLTPLFLAGSRAGGADRDPPDPAGAEERRPVPVADVPAADPVRVGAPPEDPQLAAAAAAARGAGADRRGVRAAVPAQPGRHRRRRPAAPARWWCCSIARSAWATGIGGRGRRPRRGRPSAGSPRGRPRVARVLHLRRSTWRCDRRRKGPARVGDRNGARRRGATRFAPALKLAGSILSESALPRREVVLISDFQRLGWQGGEGLRLPDGATLDGGRRRRPTATSNVSSRPPRCSARFSGQERVTVTGGVLNHGARGLQDSRSRSNSDGRVVRRRGWRRCAGIGVGHVRSDHAGPRHVHARFVRLGADALPADNAFHFTLAPRQPARGRGRSPRRRARVRQPVPGAGAGPQRSPPVRRRRAHARDVTPMDIQRRRRSCAERRAGLRDAGTQLASFVEGGGGVLVGAGRARGLGGQSGRTCCRRARPAPVIARAACRRASAASSTATRSSSRSARRAAATSRPRYFYSYRQVTPDPDGRVLARFDDGARRCSSGASAPGACCSGRPRSTTGWTDLRAQAGLPAVHPPDGDEPRGVSERPPWMRSATCSTRAPARQARRARTPRRAVAVGPARHARQRGPRRHGAVGAGFYEIRSGAARGGDVADGGGERRPRRGGPDADGSAGRGGRGDGARRRRLRRERRDDPGDRCRPRAPPTDLVVPAVRGGAAARGRNGGVEQAVAKEDATGRTCDVRRATCGGWDGRFGFLIRVGASKLGVKGERPV